MPVQTITVRSACWYSTSLARRTVTGRMRLVCGLCFISRSLPHEEFDFVVRETAPPLWLQFVIPQKSDARTPQLDHRVSDEFKHSADLLVLPFVKQNLKPGVGFRLA